VVEFEIDRLLPVARDEVYFDFLVRDPGAAERIDVLVIAVQRRVVAEHLAALENAGVRARSVSITPVALLDLVSFVSNGESASVLALVDDGGIVEMDLIARNALRSSHLVRPDEMASPVAIDRLVADEITSSAMATSDVRVHAWSFAPAGSE